MSSAFAAEVEDLIKESQYESALALCDAELTRASGPAAAHVWIVRAQIHRAMGRHADAVDDACNGLQAAETHTGLLFDRGLSYIEQQDFVRALEDMEKIPTLEADGRWFGYAEIAHLFRAFCLLALRRYGDCLVACEGVESDARWWILGALRTRSSIADEARALLAASRGV
ncbi:MAG: hypothetical protein JWN48_2538 [Myxococcaceae bacterium]|nr:hypothetical protein [Myxococcaceae bacterium]